MSREHNYSKILMDEIEDEELFSYCVQRKGQDGWEEALQDFCRSFARIICGGIMKGIL